MAELTTEQQNEVERQRRLTKAREKAVVFREVFGIPGKLTPHGKVILDALHAAFGKGLPRNMLDDHGRTDMWQTARCLGHYDVLESIYDTLNYKESEQVKG
jgi:hypothetical protein